jgi:iron complex outermembrane receptor protein
MMNLRIKTLPLATARALGLGLALSAAAALAQQAQKIEKIEVTGSNIKRIEGETALPVTIIAREEIERTGVTTTAELLDKVSSMTSAGYALAVGVGDSGTPGLSAANLRGLGSTNTLILLNGRRLSNYALNSSGGGTVNLNQIPLAAIERIEVLKDGASAIYGTDAIGGVINFIMRRDFTGADVSALFSDTDRGGGRSRKYNATVGWGDLDRNRVNVIASFDYQKDEALLAKQREFGSTAIRPDMGFARTSGNVFPANFVFNGVNYNITARDGCIPEQGSYRVNAATGAPEPLRTNCRYDFTSVLDIFPPFERKGFFGRATFRITNDHQAFAEYHFNQNETVFASSETPINDFLGNGPFLYPAGGPFYPTSFVTPAGDTITPTGDLPFAWRGKQAGRRTNRVETDEDRLVAGLQGSFSGWDYNTAFYRASSEASDNYIDGWMRESILNVNLRTGLVDVFSGNPQTPQGQALIDAAKILEEVRHSKATTTGFDGKVSKELMQMRGGPLALAMGFDHRKEEIDDRPASVLSSGDVLGGGGNQPAWSTDRTVTALFAELNVPLAPTLEATLAVRTDDYSDFGRSTNPKVAIRWNPDRQTLVRASYSTGFRAPTLADVHLPRFFSNTPGAFSDPIRCPNSEPIGGFVNAGLECDAQFQNQLGGNAELQPEKSQQWTMGVIFEPTPTISLGLDIFSIHRRNSLGYVGDARIFGELGVLDPLNATGLFVRQNRTAGGGCVGDLPGSPTPAGTPCAIDYVVMVQQNLGKYTVTGADVSASGRFGPVSLRFEGTYIARYRFQWAIDGPYTDNVGRYTTENGPIPRWRHNFQANWRSGPWGATFAQNFVSGYEDQGGTRDVGSYETFDLQGTWAGWKGLTVTLGVRNIFDRDPPASAQDQTFQVGYEPRIGDPHGRTFYAGLRYSFR